VNGKNPGEFVGQRRENPVSGYYLVDGNEREKAPMEQSEASKLVESLYDDWAIHLAHYAFQLTSSCELAEDLLQEAFMTLYRALRDGAQIEHPRAWTAAVVRNLASVLARNRRRRGEVLTSPNDFDLLPGPQAGPAERDGDDLTAYMDVLSKREAEALLLRIESHRYREIASRLGVSPKTVATLLARGLRKLQAVVLAKTQGETPIDRKESRVFKTLQ
jgi:RNA polymerase sigma-70 factor, ECF subfamily